MDRKQLLREYKQTPRPAGMFVVRNDVTGTWLVGSSPDLPGILNRVRFQLEMGSHPDKELQTDWNTFGSDSFAIEVLDLLEREDGDTGDVSEDLVTLRNMWLERLRDEGRALYPTSLRGI